MRSIKAIFIKQIKETIRNATVLIQFILLPLLTVIMNCAIKIPDMPENFFTEMFSAMYVGMAPLMVSSTIVAEEKEKGTLKALLMSGVKPFEYLLGVGSYIFIVCMLGSVTMAISGSYDINGFLLFLAFSAIAISISVFLGATVGIKCRSQISATSVSVVLMMIFAFLPMLSMFNDTIEKIAKYTYTRQIQLMIANFNEAATDIVNWLIIMGNFCIITFLFIFAYKKDGFQ